MKSAVWGACVATAKTRQLNDEMSLSFTFSTSSSQIKHFRLSLGLGYQVQCNIVGLQTDVMLIPRKLKWFDSHFQNRK